MTDVQDKIDSQAQIDEMLQRFADGFSYLVRDVAAVAAEIAVSPADHAGKTYWPTGPESLSGNDVAEIFTKPRHQEGTNQQEAT
jgi:hypothetical protein